MNADPGFDPEWSFTFFKNGLKLCGRPDMRQPVAIVIDNNRVYLGVSHYIVEISYV